MKTFWILYVLLLVSGTLAIYEFAPRLTSTVMPYAPNWMKPQDPTLVTTTVITNRVIGTIVPKDSPKKDPPKPKEVLPEDESFVSPAMEGIYYARQNEDPDWGVTFQKTTFYNAKGMNLGIIEGGEILDCLKGKLNSTKGDLLECRIRSNTNAPVMIARKDAHFFTGDYNKLTTKQIEMLAKYYQLTTKIAERRKKMIEDNALRNPYFQESRTAYLALMKNIEEAKALQQQLATATDSKKMALDEQLRALKVKETSLKATFDAAQKKFVEWKTAHAIELPNPDTDPTIKAWLAEKKNMISALPGLAF